MLNKLKNLTKFNKQKLPDLESIRTTFCDGLFNVMEDAFSQRKQDSNNSNFTEADIDKIIQGYAKRNMLLAAASSVVPGPFGVLTSIPELLLNFGNQMNMIYDMGCAHGKESFINKDILLDIPMAAFGGNTNLAMIQDTKMDLNDSPTELLIQKANQLGESVIEKSLKKSIVQFIPIAGPVLMTTWAKVTTLKVSKNSKNFLSNTNHYVEHFKREETNDIKIALQIEKIKGLANLIESNNEINQQQIEFIEPIIQNSAISEEKKSYFLEEALKTGSNFQLDYQLLKDFEEDETLIMELAILAKRSGTIDEFEKEYIYKVGHELNIETSFIDELV